MGLVRLVSYEWPYHGALFALASFAWTGALGGVGWGWVIGIGSFGACYGFVRGKLVVSGRVSGASTVGGMAMVAALTGFITWGVRAIF